MGIFIVFRFPAIVRPFFSLCIRLIYLSRVSTVRRRRSPYFFVIAEFGKLRISDRTFYAAVMGYRIHKCRVKAAPRALLRKGAKRARRQLFAYPTRIRPRSFRQLKVCRRIRTPRRARLTRAYGARRGAAVLFLRYSAAVMTASPRTEVRGLAYIYFCVGAAQYAPRPFDLCCRYRRLLLRISTLPSVSVCFRRFSSFLL